MRMVTARESARQCVRSTHGGSPGTASVAKNTRAAHSRRGDVPITMDAVLTETLFLDHLDTSTRPHESIAVSRFPQQNIPKRAQGGVQQRVAALEREIAASAGSRSQHPVHASATPIAGSPRSKYIGRTTGGSRLRESSLSYSESKTRMTKQVADSKKKMVTFVSSVENPPNVANAVYSMDSFDHVHDRLKDRFGATLAEHELGRACEFLGYPLLSCELDEAKALLAREDTGAFTHAFLELKGDMLVNEEDYQGAVDAYTAAEMAVQALIMRPPQTLAMKLAYAKSFL